MWIRPENFRFHFQIDLERLLHEEPRKSGVKHDIVRPVRVHCTEPVVYQVIDRLVVAALLVELESVYSTLLSNPPLDGTR